MTFIMSLEWTQRDLPGRCEFVSRRNMFPPSPLCHIHEKHATHALLLVRPSVANVGFGVISSSTVEEGFRLVDRRFFVPKVGDAY